MPLCPSSAQSIPNAIGWIDSAVRLTTWRYHSSEETEFNRIYGFVQRIANGLLCLRLVQLKRVMAIRSPFPFFPSFSLSAMRKVAYWPSTCFAGNVTDQLEPLACFSSDGFSLETAGVSSASRTRQRMILGVRSRARITIRQSPSFSSSGTSVAPSGPSLRCAATKHPFFAPVQLRRNASTCWLRCLS